MPTNYISHLKICYYRKFKDRIDRNSFASTFKSKLHLLLFYPSTWYIYDFFLFHIEIEGKGGWIIGGGGGGGGESKGYAGPPSQIIGGGAWPLPGSTSSHACVTPVYASVTSIHLLIRKKPKHLARLLKTNDVVS